MDIDRSKIQLMPLIRGPLWDVGKAANLVFQSVESLMLVYETEPDAIPPLLPEPFKPGKKPLVTVLFTDNIGVDFMAGGGYRFAAISVAAQFDGEDGQIEGNYVLVMPEDKTLPIITGRELGGMPKFFTDLSPIRRMDDGHFRCEASLWGHLLFGIDISPMKRQNAIVRQAAGARSTKSPAFGYKYIPALDGPPDADYPTIMWTDNKVEYLELGSTGELYFGDVSEKDIGDYKPIIDALKSLSVKKVTQTAYSQGSMVQRNDKNGRLR